MSNKVIWSSFGTAVDLGRLSPEELRSELVDYGFDAEILADMTGEELNVLLNDDIFWQIDLEDFEYNVLPMINKQTDNGIVLMVGKMHDQNHDGGMAVTAEMLKGGDIDHDVYDVEILDNGEGLVWVGHYNDGSRRFDLYSIPEDHTKFINECMTEAISDELMYSNYTPEDDEDDVADEIHDIIEANLVDLDYLNEYVDFSKVPEVCKRIKNEYKYEESLNESKLNEDFVDIKYFRLSELNSMIDKTVVFNKKVIYSNLDYYDLEDEKPDFNKLGFEITKDGDVVIPEGYTAIIKGVSSDEGYNPELYLESNGEGFELALGFVEFGEMSIINPSLEGSLNEASTKEPKKLKKELKEIKSLVDTYGREYLTSQPFTSYDNDPISIEMQYPQFFKIVKAYFKEMGLDIRDNDDLDINWDEGIDDHDWEVLMTVCDKLIARPGVPVQFEKIYKTGYNSFLDDDQILADREKEWQEESLDDVYYPDTKNARVTLDWMPEEVDSLTTKEKVIKNVRDTGVPSSVTIKVKTMNGGPWNTTPEVTLEGPRNDLYAYLVDTGWDSSDAFDEIADGWIDWETLGNFKDSANYEEDLRENNLNKNDTYTFEGHEWNGFSSADDWGMTEEEFESEVKDYEGKTCVITSTEVEVDDDFEDNYYNIKFADGHELHGVSGVHLKKEFDESLNEGEIYINNDRVELKEIPTSMRSLLQKADLFSYNIPSDKLDKMASKLYNMMKESEKLRNDSKYTVDDFINVIAEEDPNFAEVIRKEKATGNASPLLHMYQIYKTISELNRLNKLGFDINNLDNVEFEDEHRLKLQGLSYTRPNIK